MMEYPYSMFALQSRSSKENCQIRTSCTPTDFRYVLDEEHEREWTESGLPGYSPMYHREMIIVDP